MCENANLAFFSCTVLAVLYSTTKAALVCIHTNACFQKNIHFLKISKVKTCPSMMADESGQRNPKKVLCFFFCFLVLLLFAMLLLFFFDCRSKNKKERRKIPANKFYYFFKPKKNIINIVLIIFHLFFVHSTVFILL